MKLIFITSLTMLYFCNLSYCQFQKEAEYDTYITRVLLQNQSERYLYVNTEDNEIKITDASHQIINSISTPCNDELIVDDARSDFETIDLGIVCSCTDNLGQKEFYILDQDGNIVKQFKNYPYIDDRYLIDFDEENNLSSVYDTRSLELIKEMPQIELLNGLSKYNDDNYYYGSNKIDSIFIYDSSLSKIKAIGFDFIDSENHIALEMASIQENNETSFYFLVLEFTPYLFSKLVDEDGSIVYDFPELSRPRFHKNEQQLQAVFVLDEGISSYDVNEKELFEVIPYTNSPYLIKSGGKYIAIEYKPNSSTVEFYNFNRELEFSVDLNDPFYSSGPWAFEDHLGNQYFSYTQFLNGTYLRAIYKGQEYLQTFYESNFIIASNIEGLTTKIFSYRMQNNSVEVYGMEVTNTKEILKDTYSISPNPVNEAFTISGDVKNNFFTIYDFTGKMVQDGFIDENEFKVDVSHLGLGMYFIRMAKKDKGYEIKKFVKTN